MLWDKIIMLECAHSSCDCKMQASSTGPAAALPLLVSAALPLSSFASTSTSPDARRDSRRIG